MTHRLTVPTLFAVVLAVVVSLCGCPRSPIAPFNATGQYAGEWTGELTAAGGSAAEKAAITCPLQMTLFHQPALLYPANMHLLGVVTFDYLCFIPEWMLDLSGLELPPLAIPVIGTMKEDGAVALDAEACLDAETCVALHMEGLGVDEDANGSMDAYGGEFSFTVSVPGLVSISLAGSFNVAAVGAAE